MDDSETAARRYHRRQVALSLADFGMTVAVLFTWLTSGAAARLTAALGARVQSPAAPMIAVAAVAAAVAGSCAAATLPIDLIAGFWLPRRAGLLVQPFRGWLGDRVKMLALGGGLGLVTLELVYALIRSSPEAWWWWSAAAIALLGLLLTAILPVWLVPLFYRLTPLEDASLHARILTLAAHIGVTATDVLVADFSRKGRTANAAVVGLGRTRRILVSDTLLGSFPPDEVEVVLAHELAHHARGHVRQGLVLQSLLMVLVLWLAGRALAWGTGPLGLSGPADPAGLPFLALVLTTLGLFATPVMAGWSRRLEREADQVALDVTRTPQAFVSAMERLGRLNLAERQPSRIKQWLFATHPSLEQRIAVGRRWATAFGGAPASAPLEPPPGGSP